MNTTNNTKYTSYLDIAQKLSREFPDKTDNINPADIAAWCAECETDYIGDIESHREYIDFPIIVNNFQALLPCTLFKLLDVYYSPYSSGINVQRVTYNNNGSYINFATNQKFATDNDGNDIIYIKYYGLAIDPLTGYPLIKKGHEQACEAFCTKKIFLSDFYSGRLNGNIWGDILQELNNQLQTAKTPFRHMSNQDMLRMQKIRFNMIQKLYKIPIYQ